LLGLGGLMIETQDGTVIGQSAVCHGPIFPEPELGWFLYAGYGGQGYATEAAAAMRDWAFGTRRLTALVSYIERANAPSIRVAERLGGVIDPAAATPFDEPDVVYRYHHRARA
jgi:RimJ/RimL family protein N-acetyltransferase